MIVDSIGLNGVQIRANENEREIFLSCEKWVPEQDSLIQLVTGNARANESTEGLQSSFPVLLKVRKPGKKVAMGAQPSVSEILKSSSSISVAKKALALPAH